MTAPDWFQAAARAHRRRQAQRRRSPGNWITEPGSPLGWDAEAGADHRMAEFNRPYHADLLSRFGPPFDAEIIGDE